MLLFVSSHVSQIFSGVHSVHPGSNLLFFVFCSGWLEVLPGWLLFFCGRFVSICGDARLQASIAAFLCLKTRARSESGTNPLIRLELPTLLHQHVALVSGANSFVQYIARWSSSFAKSCAMTDSMAMDLSTGVGQHRDIKGRLAFAYGAWTVADACSPARARFCTYGFAGAPP